MNSIGIGLIVGKEVSKDDILRFQKRLPKKWWTLYVLNTDIEGRFDEIFSDEIRVWDYEWNNSFSDCRNRLIQEVSVISLVEIVDWLFFLDIDETIEVELLQKMQQLELDKNCAYSVKIVSRLGNSNIENYHCRLIPVREKNQVRYAGRVHEQVNFSNVEHRYLEDIQINHFGYTEGDEYEKKVERNIKLFEMSLEDIKGNTQACKENRFLIYNNLVTLYSIKDKFKETQCYFEKAYSLYRKDMKIDFQALMSYSYMCLANLYIKDGCYKKAKGLLKECMKNIDNRSSGIQFLYCVCLLNLENYKELFQELIALLEKKGRGIQLIKDTSVEEWKALRLLGKCFYKVGMHLEALRCFLQVKNKVIDLDSLKLTVECLRNLGFYSEARKLEQRVRGIDHILF